MAVTLKDIEDKLKEYQIEKYKVRVFKKIPKAIIAFKKSKDTVEQITYNKIINELRNAAPIFMFVEHRHLKWYECLFKKRIVKYK